MPREVAGIVWFTDGSQTESVLEDGVYYGREKLKLVISLEYITAHASLLGPGVDCTLIAARG